MKTGNDKTRWNLILGFILMGIIKKLKRTTEVACKLLAEK